jgi:histidinol-phosphate aminotransferase
MTQSPLYEPDNTANTANTDSTAPVDQPLIDRLIRSEVRAMHSYAVADASGLIKLDAMENPFPLPQALADELGSRLGRAALNRYPAPRPSNLLAALKRSMGVPARCDLLLGNGSDEIISIMAMACARPGASILAPVPGFVMYQMSAQLAGIEFVGVPLKPDLSLDLDAMTTAIVKHQPALIYLAYPNNPTGTLYGDAEIEQILAVAGNSLVVIDEAYQPFAQRSWMSRAGGAGNTANLLVMRTLSKLGLAGIRLGYLAGSPQWLHEFDKVRPPYNINVLTQITAEFLLEHLDVLDAQAAALCDERAGLARRIAQLPGVEVFPSAGNFLLVRVPNATALFEQLLAARILIKNVSKMHPLLSNCVRLTVGTADENASLLAALRTALA